VKALPALLRVLVVAAAVAIPWTQQRIDARLGGYRAAEEAGLYLWSGKHVRRLLPGFESVAADLYWIRTVQYFGGKRAFSRDRNFALLEPLTDITVTLDPRLDIAYRYGAVFLAEPKPAGAGRPHSAVKLLERGAAANPENWRLRKELGYFHFIFLNDAHKGAEVLLEAADLPGAAYWLRTLAADMLGRGGDRETSRKVWMQMYQEEEQGAIKANALTHLLILDSLDLRDELQKRVLEFGFRNGRRPRGLEELVSSGLVQAIPLDPRGVPFEYDAKTGIVSVSPRSPLWRPDR
jgi:hypothetical protein